MGRPPGGRVEGALEAAGRPLSPAGYLVLVLVGSDATPLVVPRGRFDKALGNRRWTMDHQSPTPKIPTHQSLEGDCKTGARQFSTLRRVRLPTKAMAKGHCGPDVMVGSSCAHSLASHSC